jgi:beta-lactamase class A
MRRAARRPVLLLPLSIALLLGACRSTSASVRIERASPAELAPTAAALRPLPPDPNLEPPTVPLPRPSSDGGSGQVGSGAATSPTVPLSRPSGGGSDRPASTATPAPLTPLAPATGEGDPALLAAIEAALGDDREHVSVVVRRLTDGRSASFNPERAYYAASLFKLALLYEAERQRSTGLLDWDERVPITERDVAEDLGTLDQLGVGVGDTLAVRDAVRAMVTRSDNTSAILLLYRLGPGAVDRTLRALGLRVTSVNTQELPTTAADMALLMEAIVRGMGVDPAWRDDMLSLLLRQEVRFGIPSGLPSGVRSGNKTGTWSTATHDVAFVDAPGGLYVLAVLSDRGWDWDPLVRVSRAVYAAMTGER